MALVGNVQLVAGNSRSVDEVLDLIKQDGIKPRGNPDVYVREYSGFGIDEARELSLKASMRALGSARRVFVLVTPGMTSDAQNALLKTLEEPSGDALFFIIVPTPQTLLPTLRSRAQVLALKDVATAKQAIDVPHFLRAKGQERLDMLKPLFDKDEDDKRDLAGSIAFLAGLEAELSKDTVNNRQGLQAVYRARKYLGDKGSLQKALLEQVALLI